MPVTQICPYLRIQYKYIRYNRPHPLYCPQFLQCQHKIGQISCPVEGGARILEVRILEVRLYCTAGADSEMVRYYSSEPPPFLSTSSTLYLLELHGSLPNYLQIDSFFSAQVNSCIQCTLHFTNQRKIIFFLLTFCC